MLSASIHGEPARDLWMTLGGQSIAVTLTLAKELCGFDLLPNGEVLTHSATGFRGASRSITLHHPPSSYTVPINTHPHYIDWERCTIGEVMNQLVTLSFYTAPIVLQPHGSDMGHLGQRVLSLTTGRSWLVWAIGWSV
ncbi:unnamed protein product [Pleuronectes platessa]|uniref:Uncharacterized protein n=1 Tax=Pleuronectes platessa TaxID=8262 RepID=A0A9N7VJU1_PLEPL|nr:unnamed protein product [Pleuronectes platessa]